MSHHPARVGLVGAGGITQVHVPAWLELGAEVTVFSDHGAEALAEQYGLAVARSYDELLDTSDVIDICTPTLTHLGFADAALDAGRHVVCEKPVALDLDAARATGRLAAERGLGLFPAHVVRYFPEYAAVKQAVDAGSIGDVAVMRFSRVGEYPSWSAWFGDHEQSGGIVVDQMIHDLDVARWFAGEVVEVYAVRSAASGPTPAVSSQVVLTHASGAVSTVQGVWGAPGTVFRTAFSVAGSNGLLEYDSRDAASLRVDTGSAPGGPTTRPDSSFTESPYLTELRDFLGAIRGEGTSRVSWADGIRAVEIALAANRSIETGEPVGIEPAPAGAAARKAVA